MKSCQPHLPARKRAIALRWLLTSSRRDLDELEWRFVFKICFYFIFFHTGQDL